MAVTDPRVAANRLINGYRQSQCIGVATELALPELLSGGPKTAAELAEESGVHQPSLKRLLRALVAMEVLGEDVGGRYHLTTLGNQLRADKLGLAASLFNSELFWRTWLNLGHSVRTGEIAFDHVHHMGEWDYYAANPDYGARFDAAMQANTAPVTEAVAAAFDFSRYRTVTDVGGGNGTLLATILRLYPGLNGVLFDRPQVIERARARFEEPGLADRVQLIGGDFLEWVPPGSDAYVMKSIIHDWEDAHAAKILQRCRSAATVGAHLLLIERVLPERVEPQHIEIVLMDLNMMVNNGGCERTESEYRALLHSAGFRLERLVETSAGPCVLESVAV